MRKKIFTAMLMAAILSLGAITVSAEESIISVILDEQTLEFDVPPTVINDRTMVPVRKLFEALGATVEYNEADETITGIKGDTTIILKVDSVEATVNGNAVTLDVPATVISGRTLVPLRFVSENLGLTVVWEEETQTIVLITIPSFTISDSYYENKEGGFKIKLPKDWEITSNSNEDGTVDINVGDDSSNINITSLESVSDLVGLKEALDILEQMAVQGFVKESNCTISNREAIKVCGQDAVWLESENNIDSIDIKFCTLLTVNESNAFMVGFTSTKAFVNFNMPKIKECMLSITPISE